MKQMPAHHRSTLALAIFASSLLVLIVNDALLKGQGLVPTWLSGKLSDFAGLIVAPITLTLLAALQRRGTQLCCLLTVAGLFTLTEVSPACAELAQLLAAQVGLSWRLWPDPSDLAALSVLPLSWFCCRALSSASGTRSSRARAARWLRLPACIACIASSEEPTFSAQGYVYNGTGTTAFVELSHAWLDCGDFEAFERAFLQPEDFVSLGLFELGSGEVLPLDPDLLGDSSGRSVGLDECMCSAMRISTSGRTVTVRFEGLASVELVQKPSAGDVARTREQLVLLRGDPEPSEIGAQLGTFDLAEPGAHPPDACPGQDLPPLDVAVPSGPHVEDAPLGSESVLRDLTLLARTPVAGNCFQVELGDAASGAPAVDGGPPAAAADAGPDATAEAPLPERLGNTLVHICAPLDMFPFEVGDQLNLTWSDLSREPPYVEYLELQTYQATFKVTRGLFSPQRYAWQSPGEWEGYEATLPSARCGPLRDAEGAAFEPMEVTYDGQALVPGSAVQVRSRNGQIYLGRARRYLGRGCGTDQSQLEVVERWNH